MARAAPRGLTALPIPQSTDPPPVGGPAHVGARGLAALWCGWSTSRLRQAALLTGGSPDGDAALDLVFAATPYLTEYF